MKKNSLKVFFFLFVTNLISHFIYLKRFGLYEDDYFLINYYQRLNINEMLDLIVTRVKDTHINSGHPLSFVPNVFSYLGDQLGGHLYILYVFAFVIVTINSFLVYKILKKCFPESEILAVMSSIAFCLFPSDNTKILLLHAFVLQTSFLYFLCATLLYLNNKKKSSYFVIILSLFSYETVYMLFYGIPFLKSKWNKEFRNDIIKHSLILTLFIAIVFVYRKLMGENKVMQATSNWVELISKTAAAMIIGPLVNLYQFVRAPIATINYWINDGSYGFYYSYIFYFIIFCLLLFYWYIFRIKSDYIREDNSLLKISDDNEVNIYFRKILIMLALGVMFLCLGYIASFTHYPPTILMGRRSSVHLAATFGSSIIFGCVCASILYLSEKYTFKKIAVFVLTVYLALLVGYNTITQKEYVQSWIFQKSFWKQIINECPDLNENTVILLSGNNKLFNYTKYIVTLSHQSNLLTLRQLYNFPKRWFYPPKVLFIFNNWKDYLSYKEDKIILKIPFVEPGIIQDSNVIFVRINENNDLNRIDTTFNLNGKIINTKPRGRSTLELYETTKLYDVMIKPD